MAQRMTFVECLFEGVMYEDIDDDEPEETRLCIACTALGRYSEVEPGKDLCTFCQRSVEAALQVWPTDLKRG